MNRFERLINECTLYNKKVWEIALEEDDATKLLDCAQKSIDAMKEAIETGLRLSELSLSGMCGDDCQRLQEYYKQKPALFGKLYEKIVTYALATSEENIRMGKIVACPTAGSCGIVPSVLVAVAEEYDIADEEQVRALITAGEIGKIISEKIALAGAVGGCQAECGVASAMAAGAVTQMLGGDVKQIFNAVALALKNILGLTCDPVCGLVEVPCVKRNPFLAIHSITACELALAGITSKIPLDEVVDAMEETAQLMSPNLKENAKGGLARTKTALELQKKIFKEQ